MSAPFENTKEVLPAKTMLVIEGLSKSFGDYLAVDGVSLAVGAGEIFGFLGPNGAGKTTTIKMLAGLLKQDAGQIFILGRDLAREPEICKQQTGYIPDRPYLYEKLTGREFLQFIRSLYRVQDNLQEVVDHLLEIFDLKGWQNHLIESYSHGMRQKLIITAAFMLAPPLIVVDEPMVGLDPKSARIVKELFRNHARQGGSVFLSTHSLEVAEELCDTIAIIMNGKILTSGTLAALRKEARMGDSKLEDIFLQLTGAYELHEVIKALKVN